MIRRALKPGCRDADNPGTTPRLTMRRSTPLLLAALLAIAGCDQLGIESPAAVAAKNEAEGKAIGAGCRHAARSVEACYSLNKRADKAAIFAGWREMNDYMRENKLEAMPAGAEPAPAAEADAEVDKVADAGDAPEGAKPDRKSSKTAKVTKAH